MNLPNGCEANAPSVATKPVVSLQILVVFFCAKSFVLVVRLIVWTVGDAVARMAQDFEVSPGVVWIGIGSTTLLSCGSSIGLIRRVSWGWWCTAVFVSIDLLRSVMATADSIWNQQLHEPITFFGWGGLRYKLEENYTFMFIYLAILALLFTQGLMTSLKVDSLPRYILACVVVGLTYTWYLGMCLLAVWL